MHAKFNVYVKLVKRTLPTSVSTVLILLGTLYILSPRQASAITAGVAEHTITASSSPQQTPAIRAAVLPVRLTLADLNIHLNIEQGVYNPRTGTWTIDDHAAYYVTGSTTPIIYAHNRTGLFAPLQHIQSGATLSLELSNGTTTRYRYVKTKFITPEDTQILSEQNQRTVVLLTCSGFFDEHRRLVYFEAQS